MLPGLQDGLGHGKPPALVLGKSSQAPAHPGLRLPPIPAGTRAEILGPRPAPGLVPQNRRAVPPSSDTALQTQGCPKRPMAILSPQTYICHPKFGMTHVPKPHGPVRGATDGSYAVRGGSSPQPAPKDIRDCTPPPPCRPCSGGGPMGQSPNHPRSPADRAGQEDLAPRQPVDTNGPGGSTEVPSALKEKFACTMKTSQRQLNEAPKGL